MNLVVEFYGGLKELAGVSEWACELEEDTCCVRDVLERLFVVIPELVRHLDSLAFAVNDEIVSQKHELSDGDRLALLPPVSGG